MIEKRLNLFGAATAKVAQARIVEKGGKWYVVSENGKNLGGPYDSKEKAKKRLRQVEYFKHKNARLQDSLRFENTAAAVNKKRFQWVPTTNTVIDFGQNHKVLTDLETGEEFATRCEIPDGSDNQEILFFDMDGNPIAEIEGEDVDDMSARLEREFEERVLSEENTTQDGDFIIVDSVRGGYDVSIHGERFVRHVPDWESAVEVIQDIAKSENWYPDVWFVNEREAVDKVTDFRY
mgnify:CR=1 FL=1